jgi:hypothetical protein
MAVPANDAISPANHTNTKSLNLQRNEGGADRGGKFTGKKSTQ